MYYPNNFQAKYLFLLEKKNVPYPSTIESVANYNISLTS